MAATLHLPHRPQQRLLVEVSCATAGLPLACVCLAVGGVLMHAELPCFARGVLC
jgi:hypothetical protein